MDNKPNIQCRIGEVVFESPVLTASGTFGYGTEILELVDVSRLGGIVTKSVTLNPREGNPPPRIAETPSGMLNSIGLANIGVKHFKDTVLPTLAHLNTRIIVNIAGSTLDEYIQTLEILEDSDGIHCGYEVNISCPNVKRGGMEYGVDPLVAGELTRELRKRTRRLIIMKLSPNVTRIEDIGMAAEDNGADAVSAINTIVGMGIDIQTRRPLLHTVFGGLSGPAIKPVALARVHKLFRVLGIPVIGLGGICSCDDIIEFMIAGASLIQIGTCGFREPDIGVRLTNELQIRLTELGLNDVKPLKGSLEYDH